jgi:hypothetical protein
MSLKETRHGIYKPINRSKYIGAEFPIFRSSWELKAFISLDRNDKILRWGSENVSIYYIDETRNNERHQYIIDLFFEIADVKKDGRPIKWLLEIKPERHSIMPQSKKGKKLSNVISESIIVKRNHCKWRAAVEFCKSKGWHFGVYTENGISKLC